MKEIFKSLLDRPTMVILLAGFAALLLGAAGKVTVLSNGVAITDPIWRIVLGAIGVGLIGLGIALTIRDARNPRPAIPLTYKYDVFLASPMAALGDKIAFDKQRAEIARIKDGLLKHAGIKAIYDSGAGLEFGKWEPEDFAADVDLEALRHSRYFLLHYPDKIVSSVLFEAGVAVGMGKPGVYIVADTQKGLPFLMQQMNNLPRKYPQVRIWECADIDKIAARIERSGKQIFTGGEEPAPA